ncbi:MAG: hypothetical protein PHE09_08085 [Oscillospiraceae bacterium]|nr:hypothetical protein [Oscillospiraceae bacterium]
MMYLRPGNLFKDFSIEKKGATLSTRGRAKSQYDGQTGEQLSAVLADAKPQEKDRWKQLQHPISHTITQKGTPKADAEDRLVLGDRTFFIQGVDDPGALGLWTIFYVEERFDGNEH